MLTRAQRGVSLIELLIAMSAGLVVVGTGLAFLVGTVSAAGASLTRVRLHQDLHTVMEAVSRDLARAGEWSLADEVAQASAMSTLLLSGTQGSISASVVGRDGLTPVQAFGFANAGTALRGSTLALVLKDGAVVQRHDLTITGVPAPDRLTLSLPAGVVLTRTRLPAGSWSILNPFAGVTVDEAKDCVLLRYDLNGNGLEDDEEHFGFRLDTARTTIQTTTTARRCAEGNWDAFTDPAFLRIGSFHVQRLSPARDAAHPIQPVPDAYLVDVQARLVRESEGVRSLEHLVQSRNVVLE